MEWKARYMSLVQLNPKGADQLFCDLGKSSYLNITAWLWLLLISVCFLPYSGDICIWYCHFCCSMYVKSCLAKTVHCHIKFCIIIWNGHSFWGRGRNLQLASSVLCLCSIVHFISQEIEWFSTWTTLLMLYVWSGNSVA